MAINRSKGCNELNLSITNRYSTLAPERCGKFSLERPFPRQIPKELSI
jgi:hypothetical protein